MQTYSTSALAKISGISVAQLKAWDRADLLRPVRILRRRGQSTERRYTREQALGVIALGELKSSGVKGRRVRDAAALLPPALSEYAYLVFDGRLLYSKSTAEGVIDLLIHTHGIGRVLRIAPLVERLS